MFKFVASDGTGSVKRQQAQKACESCRKRKKRCNHAIEGNSESPSYSPARASTQVHSEDQFPQGAAKLHTASSLSRATDAEYRRTISHEDPGAISSVASNLASSDQDLEAARILSGGAHIRTNTSQSQEASLSQSRFIGDLNPESIFLAATSPDAIRNVLPDSVGVWLSSTLGKKACHPSNIQQSSSNLFYGSAPLIRDVLVPIIEQECLSTMSPTPHLAVLSRIYFEKINPIFPIIDEIKYHNLPPSSPARILLEQAICLAASKNFSATEHLILNETDSHMTCRAFGEKLSGAMRLTIELGIVTDKIILIQALCLLSLFIDNSSSEDLASQFSGKAAHYLQGMGLHLEGQQEDASTKLLCCVYALDRMNAAFHGRPVLMHERDLRKDLHQCFRQQEPPFRLFLQVILLLDNVIEIYRPLNQSEHGGMDVEFPAFEDLVSECGTAQIGTSSLEQLVLFPFVPYALSLSLSIAYREMRHNKLPVHRMRARGQFQASCRLLEGLEGKYWTAANAANMGKKMLREIDRVFSTVSSENKSTAPQQDVNSNTDNNLAVNDHSTSSTSTDNQLVAPTPNTQMTTPSIAPIYGGQMQDVDPSLFNLNATGDIDLFSMFDPSFDLDSFDACLEGNLNPGFPTPAPHP
ncbi:hypothetical protein NHQ30_007204 [Ciborinia camelliae]|nr:hypothetical protein NHQ30_007204 [Ciborinia camelliae]